MLDLPLWDWEARRGRSLLSHRSGAFPEIGVSAIVVVHHTCSFVSVAHMRGHTKAPVPLVDEGYAPYRGTTTVLPRKGPLPVRRDHDAGVPSRANGRIPGTATATSAISPSGSGVSCGRVAAALSALAFSPGSRSLSRLALSLNPHHSQLILRNAHAV